MLDKLARFIIKRKYWILIAFVTVFVLAAVGSIFVSVNSDITSYLPKDSLTAEGQVFLRQTFGMDGDLSVIVKASSDMDIAKKELGNRVDELATTVSPDGKRHVTGAMWYGSLDIDEILGSTYLGDISDILGKVVTNLKDFLVVEAKNDPAHYFYIVNVVIDIPSSDPNAVAVYEAAEELFASELADGTAALGGGLATIKQTMDETLNAMPLFIAVAVAVVLIILLFTTKSWLEPFILLASIGVSIIINLGTNVFFSDVSVITQAISAILQLGLTMDYAIFLMHSYHSHLQKYSDSTLAIKKAVPQTVVTIAASALTTVGGFVAMAFMGMGIGLDMAKVLAKGILISLLTIALLQPVLMLTFKNLLEKGRHAYVYYDFKRPTATAINHKGLIAIVVVALIAVCGYLQTLVAFDYLKMSAPIENPTEAQTVAANMGNQILLGIPVESDNEAKQFRMLEDIYELRENTKQITTVTGLFSLVDEEDLPTLKSIMLLAKLDPVLKSTLASFYNEGYAVYMIHTTCESESAESLSLLASITSIVDEHFGESSAGGGTKYYISGIPQAVKDLSDVTPNDQMIVNVLSVVFIFAIVLFTLRSLKKTLLVVLLIEGGIWINLAIYTLAFGSMNFIAQMVVTALQMGATVDYAILMSTAYKNFRNRGFEPRFAAKEAAKQSSMSIATSASILAGACLALHVLSPNIIIRQVTLLIAIGALLSAVLIIFVLPGLLVYSDVPLKKLKNLKYFLFTKREQKVILSNGDVITKQFYDDVRKPRKRRARKGDY